MAAVNPPIRVGRIYWFDNCPPLDGVDRKRRPVIIVLCEDETEQPVDPIDVVGVTTDPTEDHDRIRMPNLQEDRYTKTGLPEPCFALPRWSLLVYRSELPPQNYMGDLEGVLLFRLLEAVNARLDEPDEWDDGSEPST